MGGFKLAYSEEDEEMDHIYLTYLSMPYRYTSQLGDGIWERFLRFDRFQDLLRGHKVDFPSTTVKEIDDRSKGDALSKGIALLQITWFIVQLIARRVQSLTITELELTTAALAGLNSVMYVFWWNKPLDVRCPIIIRTKAVEKILAGRLYETELKLLESKLTNKDGESLNDVKKLLAKTAKNQKLVHDWEFEDPMNFRLGSYIAHKYVVLQLLEMNWVMVNHRNQKRFCWSLNLIRDSFFGATKIISNYLRDGFSFVLSLRTER